MTLVSEIVRFDDARPRARSIAYDIAATGLDVLIVRDVLGRFSIIIDDRRSEIPKDRVIEWRDRIKNALGKYVAERPLIQATTLFSADSLLASERIQTDPEQRESEGGGKIGLLDNTVVGEDWSQVTTPSVELDGSRTHRTALYGFKGGVGRTTASAILARHLADNGHIVLVVDLDLESPGVGSLLGVEAILPSYGIVDQIVEAAVGNADGLDIVSTAGYTPRSGRGELWIAPARGRGAGSPYSYVDKLNRVYADIPGGTFADRVEGAVRASEDAVARLSESGRRPDVVLLDSRAGIHDIAAVTISRICDLALLFGSDNRQTWEGYGDLFSAWRSSGQARSIREKLRMIASMVPDSPQRPMDEYLRSFREHSWECFSVLYDDDAPAVSTGELVPGAFSPALEDDSAPHYPIPILFEPGLVGLDSNVAPGWQDRAFVQAAYRDFLRASLPLIISDPQIEGNR